MENKKLEKLIDTFSKEIFHESKNERKIILHTGKQGIIEYFKALHKAFKTSEEIEALTKKWNEELQNVSYIISDDCITVNDLK